MSSRYIVIVTGIFIIVGLILLFYFKNKLHLSEPIAEDTRPCLFEVDAVVTWVDHTDLQWTASKQHHSQIKNPNRLEEGLKSFRFDSVGELYYCLKGIQTYLPWIRTVYLVTMRPQKPSYLDEFPKVKVVHHDEIFEVGDSLPTFNSNAIETSLYRIAGLTEHFIYFNDDCFIGKPLSKNFFFTPEGQPWMYNRNHINIYQQSNHEMLIDYGLAFTPSAPAHQAIPLKKEYFETIWSNFPDPLMKTQKSRFREEGNIWMVGLVFQLYQIGWFDVPSCIIKADNLHLLIFMTLYTPDKIKLKLHHYEYDKTIPALICINDVKLDNRFHLFIWRQFTSIYEKKLKELPQVSYTNQRTLLDPTPLNFKLKLDTNNFGDSINKVFWEKLINRPIINNSTGVHYITTGSIMNLVDLNSIIFGTGFISSKGDLGGGSYRSKNNNRYSTPTKVVMVRGPKSRRKLLDLGIECPEHYGDPLVLFPCIYEKKTTIRDDVVGIIPHYTDKMSANINKLKHSLLDNNYKVNIINIEVGTNYQQLIEEINKCKWIISSSLHGVIMGIVYRKLTIHLEFSNNIIGGNFKFDDFFESLDIQYSHKRGYTCDILANTIDLDYTNLYRLSLNIINICPFISPYRKPLLEEKYTRFYRK